MLKLVKLDKSYRKQLFDMMDEWTATDEIITPYALRKNDYHDFDVFLQGLNNSMNAKGVTPNSTYFCLDENRNIFVGVVNIRHCLNDKLLLSGGHIGDGVRPSERGKGFATKMIALALEKCGELGIEKVLMTCDKNNPASARTIQKNCGILENEVDVKGKTVQRYWIDNSKL